MEGLAPELLANQLHMPSDVEEEENQEGSENGSGSGSEDLRKGDDLYQLTRPEGEVTSAKEWKEIFIESDFAEEILEKIELIKPYERDEKTGVIICTKSMNELVAGICLFFNRGGKIKPRIMKSLCDDIFSHCDLLYCLVVKVKKMISNHEMDGKFVWHNLFNFLRFTPNPAESVKPILFSQKFHMLRSRKKVKLVNAWQAAWIEIMRCNIPKTVLINMIPFITDNVIGGLREPHRTSDFFFKIFEQGDVLSILSLGAIFKLMVNHNFDYPNFYDQVYSLTKPFVFHMTHKKKFIELLNIFLSSTHLPHYVIAGFAKRLSRCLLYAPLDAQETILGFIRNLITRHSSLVALMHREVPATLDNDPYDMDEPSLNKCNATESSLWEIKTLQEHWNKDVAKRANFVDKPSQKIESIVRDRCMDEYFARMMSVKYGEGIDEEEEHYNKSQNGFDNENGSDEEDVPQKRQNRRGRFFKETERKEVEAVPVCFSAPSAEFFPLHTVTYDYGKYWKI